MWQPLEVFVWEPIQRFIENLLEDEVTTLWGRPKAAYRAVFEATAGMPNGYGTSRRLSLSAGTITVRRHRIHGLTERFVSRVLPFFARWTREVDELLPTLYLHGLALGNSDLAWCGLLGDAAPLSAASLRRFKTSRQLEYAAWKQRRLEDLEVVYRWANSLSVKAGLEDIKATLLVLISALVDGRKLLLEVESGQREPKGSWGAVWRDLRVRGLTPWRCTVAEGHLGI
jgi:putative transposase